MFMWDGVAGEVETLHLFVISYSTVSSDDHLSVEPMILQTVIVNVYNADIF